MDATLIAEQHRRLGRHVEHDERSLAFPAAQAPALVSALHKRLCPPFDQGNLGSCTGNAMAGLLMTEPYHQGPWAFTEKEAISLYSEATKLDGVRGNYPPTDTGSSGLAVAKAAKNRRYIVAYAHAFGLDHALAALVLGPVIIGINWYSSFDAPDPHGLVSIAHGAYVRGGHEVELVGLDTGTQQVLAVNSWGVDWGNQGTFSFSWTDFDRLLHEHGDVTTVRAYV